MSSYRVHLSCNSYDVKYLMCNACMHYTRTVTAPFTSKETCRDNAEATNGAEDEKA